MNIKRNMTTHYKASV